MYLIALPPCVFKESELYTCSCVRVVSGECSGGTKVVYIKLWCMSGECSWGTVVVDMTVGLGGSKVVYR